MKTNFTIATDGKDSQKEIRRIMTRIVALTEIKEGHKVTQFSVIENLLTEHLRKLESEILK